MRLFLLLGSLVLLGCEAPAPEPDGGAVDGGHPVRLRVATFNVRLFFDTVCESGACGAADFEQAATPTAFDARATQLAQALTKLNADVVAVEEFENQVCLDAVLAKLAGVLPYGALGETGAPGSVDVGVLSKTPLAATKGWRNLTRLTRPDGSRTNFSREFLEARVTAANGVEVVLFAAHFRSKSSPDDPGRRLAEAQTARQIVSDTALAQPAALVVMAGDLNDTPGSAPLDALTANDGLRRAAADLPVADQATYVFNGTGEAIDHVLQGVTPAGAVVPRSAKVWKDARGYGGSDHFALSADFDVY